VFFPSRENYTSSTLRTETAITQFLGTSGILSMLSKILGLDTLKPVVELVVSWSEKPQVATDISFVSTQVVEKLSNIQGIKQSRGTKFKKATPKFKLKDGTIIKTYRNSAGVNYVFLADVNGKMIFGGYVYRRHSDELKITISEIKTTFAASETDTSSTSTKPKFQDIFKR
jgi:hypothetical protein